jgi:hypothetical protein
MCRLLALEGVESSTERFFRILTKLYSDVLKDSPFIFYTDTDKRMLMMVNFKFGSTSEEDIARAYRKAKSVSADKIIIMSCKNERRVMSFAASLDVFFRFYTKHEVRNMLVKYGEMPKTIISNKNKIGIKALINSISDNIFSGNFTKRYFFVGIILFSLSFFTPLKLYYITIATIALLLAGIGTFLKLKSEI